MLFDLYVPTRTAQSVEARVRTSAAGPVELRLGDRRILNEPRRSHGGMNFHAHTFEDLPSGTPVRLEARHERTRAVRSLETKTLDPAPGARKLRVGIVADLHLPERPAPIEGYPRGARRLPGLAHELATRYLPRLEALGADAVVLPGDLVDPCTPGTLDALRQVLQSVSIPCYPIIGNHEPWSSGGEALFYARLGLPEGGHYAVRLGGVRLILLSTPAPDAIGPGSAQLRWLEGQLSEASEEEEDVALFSHFSLLLHPCVQGLRNDGYQLLDNHGELLDLLEQSPRVRVFAAGHKNVPSKLVHRGVVHLLSPQLIQAPCGYDMLTFYDGGLARTTWEIEEQHYCEVARAAYEHIWPERCGHEDDRNFLHCYR